MSTPRPLRSPDEALGSLPGFPWAPHYVDVPDAKYGSLRMHYLDEGPADGRVVVLLHGQGCWSYAFRNFIAPLTQAGLRVIAPDYIGFGRSDKLLECEDYSFQSHLDWLSAFFDRLQLRDVTAYCFDWGGFFALRLAGERPELFARLVLSNTMLPLGQAGGGREWFLRWREEQFALPRFPQGEMVNSGVVHKLSPDIIAAYDAPYPDESYKTGPRRFPMILPIWPEDPACVANRLAWENLARWDKPVLTVYAASLGSGSMGPGALLRHIPGTRGQPHALLESAGFYIIEDQSAELAQRIGESALA
ncbi:MAG: alpha/beta fold hydrolase [Gammaproteobacteria bacterium]|nr:alpha/beta fold hydrolase [Gammaproteobacteria bacterium]